MSHVEFKKRQRRPVDFKGQGPYVLKGTVFFPMHAVLWELVTVEYLETYPQRDNFLCYPEMSFNLTLRLKLKSPLMISTSVPRLFSCSSSTFHD